MKKNINKFFLILCLFTCLYGLPAWALDGSSSSSSSSSAASRANLYLKQEILLESLNEESFKALIKASGLDPAVANKSWETVLNLRNKGTQFITLDKILNFKESEQIEPFSDTHTDDLARTVSQLTLGGETQGTELLNDEADPTHKGLEAFLATGEISGCDAIFPEFLDQLFEEPTYDSFAAVGDLGQQHRLSSETVTEGPDCWIKQDVAVLQPETQDRILRLVSSYKKQQSYVQAFRFRMRQKFLAFQQTDKFIRLQQVMKDDPEVGDKFDDAVREYTSRPKKEFQTTKVGILKFAEEYKKNLARQREYDTKKRAKAKALRSSASVSSAKASKKPGSSSSRAAAADDESEDDSDNEQMEE